MRRRQVGHLDLSDCAPLPAVNGREHLHQAIDLALRVQGHLPLRHDLERVSVQHRDEIERRRGRVDGHGRERVADDRQPSRVIRVGVGNDDRIEPLVAEQRQRRERLIGSKAHPAVDEHPRAADLHERARRPDSARPRET